MFSGGNAVAFWAGSELSGVPKASAGLTFWLVGAWLEGRACFDRLFLWVEIDGDVCGGAELGSLSLWSCKNPVLRQLIDLSKGSEPCCKTYTWRLQNVQNLLIAAKGCRNKDKGVVIMAAWEGPKGRGKEGKEKREKKRWRVSYPHSHILWLYLSVILLASFVIVCLAEDKFHCNWTAAKLNEKEIIV